MEEEKKVEVVVLMGGGGGCCLMIGFEAEIVFVYTAEAYAKLWKQTAESEDWIVGNNTGNHKRV